MAMPSTIRKEIYYTSFLCIIATGLVVMISLILTSCSFMNSNKCPSFDKHHGTILNSFVGSHYNYGYSDVRYYIVNNVTLDNGFNCVMISDSNHNTYLEAVNVVNDMLMLNSSINVYTNGNNKGCLDELPKESNTGLTVVVVLLFIFLIGMMYWICLKIEKLIAVRKFINNDGTNYNLLNTKEDLFVSGGRLKQPYEPVYIQNNLKKATGLLDSQVNNGIDTF